MLSNSVNCSFIGTHLSVQHPSNDYSHINQVTENSKIPFFGSHLNVNSPCIMLSKSPFPMWLLYTNTRAGHAISTCSLFLPIKSPHLWLGSSSTNANMRAPVLLYFNITGGTLTESNFVAYSWEKPRDFFIKSCSVENLLFGICFVVQYQYSEFRLNKYTKSGSDMYCLSKYNV
jgi:hypothetical protein